METENKYFEKILKKQCKMVGADYDKLDGKKERWFEDYIWTEKQQDEFHDWLVDYLKDRKVARSLTHLPNLNKKLREGFAGWWILDWGWKCTYDK